MGTMKEAKSATTEPALRPLNRLIGHWTTEATHPAVPGVIVRGTTTFEWLEGERFLISRARTDHPDFPDAICIIGFAGRDRAVTDEAAQAVPEDQLSMQYFDSRGVHRVFDVTADDDGWRATRAAPGFSQRFTNTFTEGGDTIVGRTQLCEDDLHWKDDLQITYRRA